MRFTIVIPVHNEEDNIVNLVNKIEQTLKLDHELVVVNDHSTDSTEEALRGLSEKYGNIKLCQNNLAPGFANALKTGFRNISTRVVVPVMGDLCDDLSTIGLLLAKIEAGYDIACASRYIRHGARVGGSGVKGFLSRIGGVSLYYLLGVPTHDIANAFKMYRKEVIESMEIQAKAFEISMEIPLKAYFRGFKITEVPTIWRERTKGASSFRILRLLPCYIRLYAWAIFKRLMM